MSLILFYTSFVLIIAMLAIKYYNVRILYHEAISNVVSKNEKHIYRLADTSKELLSKIHFENLNKLIMKVASFIKRESIYLKKRFDSKQPKFLLKTEMPNSGKHSVSFFLKHISDHKNSLKKKSL